ncbi:class F sortase [Jatrophihabitans sp. YIM 134969]
MPPADPARSRRLLGGVAVVLAAALALTGCAADDRGERVATPTPTVSSSGTVHRDAPALPTLAVATPTATATSTESLPPLPASPAPLGGTRTAAPLRLQIPSIGVDTGLENLGLESDGSLQPPTAFPMAGWYARGVRPGDPGPAIVAGHVDSYRGPAVFYDLGKLQPGDVVLVTRADRSTLKFVVDSKAQYAKAQFPTAAVYGPTPTPELRLITCTGIFDRSKRSYEDNLVVTAVLTG